MSQDFTGRGSDELFVGRSGYLLGLLLLRRDLKTEVLPDEQVDLVIQMLLKSGKNYSAEINMTERLPLMYQYHGKPYLGSAHGLAGILQVLTSFPNYFKQHPDEMSKLKKSIDFLMDTCVRNGNVATNLDGSLSGQGKNLVHWCHGASGVIYTFARAYLLFGKDEKYLKTCHELAETVWEKGLLKKGPGICHGVSGSGYVFLLMYRLTGDSKRLYRAERFANFLLSEKFKREARIPDKPYSLFEGLAGTVCFLTDLLKPTTAEFPLCNVFVDL
uniref:LanC-like protein 3 n=1 Tax=Phallusia mammillata TaxID=59560 RepID=A0A6F9DJR2_9ASCI|nr:lanC-like protein 3 [Phallusia mammillata]